VGLDPIIDESAVSIFSSAKGIVSNAMRKVWSQGLDKNATNQARSNAWREFLHKMVLGSEEYVAQFEGGVQKLGLRSEEYVNQVE
jgi:hypothetical protein